MDVRWNVQSCLLKGPIPHDEEERRHVEDIYMGNFGGKAGRNTAKWMSNTEKSAFFLVRIGPTASSRGVE